MQYDGDPLNEGAQRVADERQSRFWHLNTLFENDARSRIRSGRIRIVRRLCDVSR